MAQSSDRKGRVIVISGPSGVGKSTIARRVVGRLEDVYLSVSATTRPRSEQEVNGREYWFMSREEFEAGIEKGRFLEWAEVFGNLYGTPKDKVDQQLEKGRDVVLEIDVQGGRQVKQRYPEAVMIFILPPDESELASRMTRRGRDEASAAEARLRQAREEIAAARNWYEHKVVNDELEKAVEKVIEIIKVK